MADENKARPTNITSKWFNDNVYDPATGALRFAFASGTTTDDPIFLDGEVSDPATRAGFAIGGIDPSGVFRNAAITPDGKLKVDAQITLSDVTLDVALDHEQDSVAIGYEGVLAEVDADQRLRTFDLETKTEVVELKDKLASSFITEKFDDLELTYNNSGPATGKIATATYKFQTALVGVVTLSYDVMGRLNRVQRTA